ncbi:hypothetical protein [Streptomyces sp. SID1034]|uniref:hypothetical protein n=1 Tax=Streptomyces sp. SID1034 TaxID=2690248 RepID=UPI00136AD16C|nr:hypothetical protein [Streptomyces sp. SID1034]MYV95705.1 hypothetical protein [Streptomyces sp. SID1034]
MRRNTARWVAATSVGLAAAAMLTACGGNGSADSNNAGGPPSDTAPSTAALSQPTSKAPDGSSSGKAAGGSDSSSASSVCHTSYLRIAAKNEGEARQNVGSILITLTNRSRDSRMAGCPGIDLTTNYGKQPVDRNKQEVGIPFHAPKGQDGFGWVYPFNNTGGSGVHVTTLMATSRNETHSVTAPVDISLPVSDKPTGRLEVTPVFKPAP